MEENRGSLEHSFFILIGVHRFPEKTASRKFSPDEFDETDGAICAVFFVYSQREKL